VGTTTGEGTRDGSADTATGSGDDDDLSRFRGASRLMSRSAFTARSTWIRRTGCVAIVRVVS